MIRRRLILYYVQSIQLTLGKSDLQQCISRFGKKNNSTFWHDKGRIMLFCKSSRAHNSVLLTYLAIIYIFYISASWPSIQFHIFVYILTGWCKVALAQTRNFVPVILCCFVLLDSELNTDISFSSIEYHFLYIRIFELPLVRSSADILGNVWKSSHLYNNY